MKLASLASNDRPVEKLKGVRSKKANDSLRLVSTSFRSFEILRSCTQWKIIIVICKEGFASIGSAAYK
jgi:hypothetical protein